MAEGRPRGRPRKRAEEHRAERITLHVLPEELEQISGAAQVLGLGVADFVRMSSLERARETMARAEKGGS